MDRLSGLVVIAPARRAGDPGSDPGPGENVSLKLLIYIELINYRPSKASYTVRNFVFNFLRNSADHDSIVICSLCKKNSCSNPLCPRKLQ